MDGEFDTELFPSVPGIGFDRIYNPPSVVLSVVAASLPGDYNQNGIVDAADYTVWRDHLGQSFDLPGENPDAATLGIVDAEDYAFWKPKFSQSNGSGSSGISRLVDTVTAPEPSALQLLIVRVMALTFRPRLHPVPNDCRQSFA